MEVLSSRVLVRSRQPDRARAFYRDVLGLAVYREFPGGTVFFLGQGFLELTDHSSAAAPDDDSAHSPRSNAGTDSGTPQPTNARPDSRHALWLQVRDANAEYQRLAEAGVQLHTPPALQPWGLIEAWVCDPEGLPIVLVEVPDGHPLRTDTRWASAPREQTDDQPEQ